MFMLGGLTYIDNMQHRSYHTRTKASSTHLNSDGGRGSGQDEQPEKGDKIDSDQRLERQDQRAQPRGNRQEGEHEAVVEKQKAEGDRDASGERGSGGGIGGGGRGEVRHEAEEEEGDEEFGYYHDFHDVA